MRIIAQVSQDKGRITGDAYAVLDIRTEDGKAYSLRVPERCYTDDATMLKLFTELAERINNVC
jgi:hypothetical protein